MTAVQSVERAFAVISCLAAGPAGVSDIAERVGLPKSTVSRLLVTLVDLGVVEQSAPGSGYRLGAYLQTLAGTAQPIRRLVDVARPHLVELVKAVGESAGLSVLDGSDVLYLDQVSAQSEIQVRDWTGERVKAHLVSSGLVLLAESSQTAIDRYLEVPLVRQTERTMTDPVALRRRLDAVRTEGAVWVIDELIDGLSSVAAPLRDSGGRVIGAIHVHGPSFRFPGAKTAAITSKVRSAAERISAALA